MAIRAKWMDPDFRPRPKTKHFCIMCGRDLKAGQPHRIVAYDPDAYEAIHSEDWEAAEANLNCVVKDPVGMDCARKLGLEWTRSPA